MADDKRKRRYLQVQLRIVQTDQDTVPGSSTYGLEQLAESNVTMLADDRTGAIVAGAEVANTISSMFEQADRLHPRPAPVTEPISAPGAIERLADRTQAAAPASEPTVSDIPF